ncbi:MAG: valine--tRNA ligase [Syntrophomonadaceae bacterium]|jgi:valyl-tRNA synthetase|nr:valine--tRNA ligase [Syntrophomonadaceae bacterium]
MKPGREIPSVYDPKKVEQKWYQYWEDNGYFTPELDDSGQPFSMVIPPPNVTGQLHLGHALNNTLQDILARWRRMQGYDTLWLPGTDHAGIATQARVEENLAQEGLSRHDLGREKFLERVWEWKNNYGDRIITQLKMLGCSCDWSRERFTMDEGCSAAVKEVFIRLYEKGLIYRDDYIVNWCPRCHTTISDIEVEHQDTRGNLWYIRYPIEDSDEVLVVATTRPETMLGDSGIAVNPKDERYRHLVGRYAILPILNRRIPIFSDEYVDKEFGTGAVKVTPAHDPNDFEMGIRHNLERIVVIGEDALMTEEAGSYQGLERYECRRQLVADLDEQGFLVKTEDHEHAVGHCYRCDTVIEPTISKQWFVRMKPLAEPAIKVAVDGELRFVPERFTRVYLNWMENIRDWCISRQLWWGHRIPVWYCQDCGEEICVKDTPVVCPVCKGEQLEQDPDVLDTWFSSALWPFSTMGWPEETRELEYFYPTSALVTGRDIIFFWVARMIFSGLEFMRDVPFYDILIHGLILDAQGRKMSKSLGNGIDPIEVIDKYGADTLRFSLITGSTPGNDIRFHWDKVENTRNFANKIWNAARFTMLNLEDYEPVSLGEEDLTLADRWMLSRLQDRIEEVTVLLEKYDLGEAARVVYEFIWDEFCDWYIELTKSRLYDEDNIRDRRVAQNVLRRVLLDQLRLLHPFMPFITEEIYQHLPDIESSIMIDRWPEQDEKLVWPEAVEEMKTIMSVIRAVRNLRSEFNIAPGVRVRVVVSTDDENMGNIIRSGSSYIQQLANTADIVIHSTPGQVQEQVLSTHLGDMEVMIPVEGAIDKEKEVARLQKDMAKIEKELQRVMGKLRNEGFLSKAPAEVVAKEKAKREEIEAKKEGLAKRLQVLTGK